MKRKRWIVLLAWMLLLSSVRVWAQEDEGWKPDDAFYLEHMEECVEHGREYYANGPNEQVIVYESPASSKVVKTLANGAIVQIDYIYTNDKGIAWGFCEFEGKFGWIPMPYMVLVYDYLCFEEDYGDQIQAEKGKAIQNLNFEDEESRQEYISFRNSSRRIRFWTYPGSSRKFTIRLALSGNDIPEYRKTFVDENGRKWGFVSYYMGDVVNRWICINSAAELVADFDELYPHPDMVPMRDTQTIEPYAGEEIFPDDYEYVQMMEKVKIAGIALGICVVVVLAILFYWKMWKKVKQA